MCRKVFFAVLIIAVTLVVSCLPTLAQQHRVKMDALQPIAIEGAEVLEHKRVAIDVGVAFEFDREIRGAGRQEYDNLRLAPLGARFGLGSGVEVGTALAFSANDANDAGAPDESGLEGVSLFGKLKLNQFSALRVGLVLAGDDDVAPYPSDEVDLFANLLLQKKLERGLLYGEFGYKAQGGDFDSNSYFNYGVGYAIPFSEAVGFNAELVGEQSHQVQAGAVANALSLVLGANLLLADSLRLAPYVSLGLNDADPDVATGAFLEMRL